MLPALLADTDVDYKIIFAAMTMLSRRVVALLPSEARQNVPALIPAWFFQHRGLIFGVLVVELSERDLQLLEHLAPGRQRSTFRQSTRFCMSEDEVLFVT